MKTGQYYFDKLSEVEQQNFIKAYENERVEKFKGFLFEKFQSFEMFIVYCIHWQFTPQGFDYWQNIANRKVD